MSLEGSRLIWHFAWLARVTRSPIDKDVGQNVMGARLVGAIPDGDIDSQSVAGDTDTDRAERRDLGHSALRSLEGAEWPAGSARHDLVFVGFKLALGSRAAGWSSLASRFRLTLALTSLAARTGRCVTIEL